MVIDISEALTDSVINQMKPHLRQSNVTPRYAIAIMQILKEYKELKFGKVQSSNSQKPRKGNKRTTG